MLGQTYVNRVSHGKLKHVTWALVQDWQIWTLHLKWDGDILDWIRVIIYILATLGAGNVYFSFGKQIWKSTIYYAIKYVKLTSPSKNHLVDVYACAILA